MQQDDAPERPNQALPPLTPEQERDLAFLAAVLGNPANDQGTRAGAAERLLDMNAPQAISVLDAALRSGDGPAMLAVVEAMDRHAEPVPELLDAAVAALENPPGETLDALSMVLARYEQSAFQPVAALALDSDREVSHRLGPIHALGAFPTRESGDQLMVLADPNRGENEAVRAAAFASLRRLSGLDFGDEYRAWRDWWDEARDKSPGDWARELVRQYQDRNAELERLNTELAQRYVALLRELYRSIPLERQLERLSADLRDEMPEVRRFAMDRIGRLLRDSERIPEEHRQQIAAALDDPSPALRLRAAELLDELDEPNLADLIAARLATETDRRVLAGYLAVLANRPSPRALGQILSWLSDRELGEAAGEALWRLLRSDHAPDPLPETVIGAAREALAIRQTPVLVRLMAYLGNEDDLSRVVPLLDATEIEAKNAVAAGLCARQLRQPLLDRADDEAVYPFAARVLAEGPPTPENFQLLAALEPTEATRPQWDEAVSALASRLSPDFLLEADEVLAATDYAGREARISVLEHAAALPPDALPAPRREQMLLRLAPLLIEEGLALRAFQLLSSLNGQTGGALAEARFVAAIHAGQYEPAAQIHAEPEAWVTLFVELTRRDAAAAVRLRDEIARRFAGQLEGEVKATFDAASASLTPPPDPEEPAQGDQTP